MRAPAIKFLKKNKLPVLIALVFAISVGMPLFLVWADQLPGADDLAPIPARWQVVGQIEYSQNDPDGSWAAQQGTSWTVPAGGVVGVDVLGHSDNGGYCYAYWGGSNPGWVSEYTTDGTFGVYNADNSYGACPVSPPTFDASGNARICQLYSDGSDGLFSYGANSLGERIGDTPNTFIPGGTQINLQARHVMGSSGDFVHCYLAVKQYSASEYFPSTSNPIKRGNDPTSTSRNASDTNPHLCPDGEYAAGLMRWHTGSDWDPIQLYCAPAPQGYLFPSTSQGTTNNCDGGSCPSATDGITLCADGYYMAGIDRNTIGSGDKDPTQIYCAPAPPPFAAQFQSESNSTDAYGVMTNSGTLQVCPDGYYLSGVARQYDSGGDNDRIKIYCSPAPVLPADFGEACGISPLNRPCGFNFACVNNICSVPARSCEFSQSGPEWTARYKSLLGGAAYGYATAVDAGGNIYVAGEEFDIVNGDFDVFLAKYHSDGSPDGTFGNQGVVVYPSGGNESGYGVAFDDAGNVYVAGRIQDGANPAEMLLLKYDQNGKLAWQQRYASSNGQAFARGVAAYSNSVYVAGFVTGVGGDQDAALWIYDSGGNLFGPFAYDNAGGSESAWSVAADTSGVYITGSQDANGGDMFVRKYNLSGMALWVKTYDTASAEIGKSVAVSQDSATVFVTGYQSTNGGDMFVQAYDAANGALLWAETYNSGGTNNDIGRGVVAGDATSGRVYVAGSQATNNDDVFLREYFSSETRAFLQNTITQALPGQQLGYGIAVNTQEELYVAGFDNTNGGQSFISKYSCNVPTGSVASNGVFTVLPGTMVLTGTTVSVDASQSSAGITSFDWNWGDGVTGPSGVQSSHAYATAGSPIITLTTTDAVGQVKDTTQSMTVVENTSPTARFTVTPSSGVSPLTVRVDGAASTAGASANELLLGDFITFAWDWGDGTAPGFGAQSSHTYTIARAIPYAISLTVTDSGGLTDATRASDIALEEQPKNITVTDQYVCPTSPTNPTNRCTGATPICSYGNQCVQCLSNAQCGIGYSCAGTNCAQGSVCPDGNLCPADGRCADASGAKNQCVLGSSSLPAQCYTEAVGACAADSDCTASVQGGVCDLNLNGGTCAYARCLNESPIPCDTDFDCAQGDGICFNNLCDFVYDCAYGPGLGGVAQPYLTSAPKPVLPMPTGVRPDGEACTQPTPTAPNNCEGINGCLYYNYNTDGSALPATANNSLGNSVANCVNTYQGGTGCVYYGDPTSSDPTRNKTNCLPSKSNAGIPAGCIVVDKGNSVKEYDCSGINGCYYYADGKIDCTYSDTITVGEGCVYEPNPAGAIACPGATQPSTAGDNFVQCLLNPDALLPGFLAASSTAALAPCGTNADCPLDGNGNQMICVSGTCFPQCDPASGLNCASGEQCIGTCNTSADCSGNLVCNGGICGCVSPSVLDPNTGQCVLGCNPASNIPCPDGQACPANGICPQPVTCLGATPTGTLPVGTTQTNIGMTTTEDSLCRYTTLITDLSGAFTNLTLFSATGATNHTTLVTGLFSLPSLNAYFVKCQAAATGIIMPQACQISFGVGKPCTSSVQCDNGLSCINGFCDAPVCAGATVNGTAVPPALALPFGTQSATIGLNTTNDANCAYSRAYADPFAQMSPFTATGGISHTSSVANLVTGNDTQYVRCQDVGTQTETYCRIPFSVGACNQEYKCENGWQCVPNTGNGNCVPVICTPSSPNYDPVTQTCSNPTCLLGDPQCPLRCSPGVGEWYDFATDQCVDCFNDPTPPSACGIILTWCELHPNDPVCNNGGPGFTTEPGDTTCNTLGYEFHGTAVTPLGNCDLVAIILAILSWLAWIVALLAVFSGLRAAYLYITAAGNEKTLRDARAFLIYTIVGVVVAILSFSIVAITRAFLNI